MAGNYSIGKAHGEIEIDYKGEGLKEAEKDIEKIEKSSEKIEKTATKTSASTKKVSDGLVVVGTAAVAGLGVAVKAASDFESGMAAVRAAGNASADEMERLRTAALKLGADTKFSATEVAAGMEALIKAGLTTSDVLNGAADAAVALAAAERIELADASEIAATAMTAFALQAKDLPNIVNTISRSASATKQTVSDFAQAMNQAGAVSKLVGLSFDDMALAITAMGKAGIIGSDAGTSLKTFLLNLQPTTKDQIKLFDRLGITVNGTANKFFDANGKIKNMTEIAGVLSKALEGQTQKQKLLTLETLFGSDAIRAAAVISDQGAAGMKNLTSEMASQLSVSEKAKIMMDTFEGTMENFKGTLESAAISLGAILIPTLKTVVKFLDQLANWFNALPDPIKEVIVWTLAIGGILMILSGLILRVGTGILKFITIIGLLIKGVRALTLAMATNPFVLLAMAVIAIAYLIWKNWDFIVATISKAWTWITEVSAKVWNALKQFFIDWWPVILGVFTGGLGLLVGLIIKNWDDIKNWTNGVWVSILQFFVNLWNNIVRFAQLKAQAMIDSVKERLSTMVKFFQDLPQNILNALGNLRTLLLNAGMDIIRGLLEGLDRAKQWVFDKIRSIGNSIQEFFASVMSIFSPSRVFRGFGEYTLEGYILGLEDMEKLVYRKIEGIAANVVLAGSPDAMGGMGATGALLPAGASSGGNGNQTVHIGSMPLYVTGNLDPTNPVAYRRTIVNLKEAIREVEREYA